MKMGKRVLSIFLVALMLRTAAPLGGFVGLEIAPKAKALAATGQCGENVFWSFDESTGALTISGTGEMYNNRNYFAENTSIRSLTINGGVTSIGELAFWNCSGLTSVTIQNNVKIIGNMAFYKCSNLTSVTIPNSVTSIGEGAFSGCGLTSITIPDSVTSIGDRVFELCTSLTSVTIPNSVTSIGDYAFYSCSSLTSTKIGNGVTSIGNYVFASCFKLTSIEIPNSVTSIGDGAFNACNSLSEINYQGTEEQWLSLIGNDSTLSNVNVNYNFVSSIPADASLYNGHSYKLFSGGKTWTEAKAYCEKLGGHLVTITTQNEQEYIQTLISDSSLRSFFIGGEKKDGSFQWITGEPFVYTYWYPGQPSGAQYLQIYTMNSGYSPKLCGWDDTWNSGDIGGGIKIPDIGFICEWDSSNYHIPSDASTYNSHSYKLYTERKTWKEARTYCSNLGGHLVTIGSSEENAFLVSLMSKISSSEDVMIGLSDIDDEGNWSTWVTGEPVTYTNWGKNEPDNRGGNQDVGCIVNGTRGYSGGSFYCTKGQWDDNGNESTQYFFICEWDSAGSSLPAANRLVSSVTYDKDYYYTGDGFYGENAYITDTMELFVALKNESGVVGPYGNYENRPLHNVTLAATVDTPSLSFSSETAKQSYSVTFDSIDVNQTVNDLLLLYPRSGFTGDETQVNVTITLSSEDFDTVQETYNIISHKIVVDPVQKHLNFIRGQALETNTDKQNYLNYSVSKQNKFGHELHQMAADGEYLWSRITSLDITTSKSHLQT